MSIRDQQERHREYNREYMRKLREGTILEGPNRIICCDCKEEFGARRSDAKRCPACRSVKQDIFYTMSQMRAEFAVRARINPEEMEEVLVEMEILEGKDFVDFALDGILERIKAERRD